MFKSDLIVKLNKNSTWTLIEPLIYDFRHQEIKVPAGFRTDFASVPRLPVLFAFIGDVGQKAAAVHDYLYATHSDRHFADDCFRQALKDSGVSSLRAGVMWLGVRMFGWIKFKR